MYRSTQHSTILRTPAEILLGRNICDKLAQMYMPIEKDEEVADRDKEKEYGDAWKCAIEIDIQ